MEMLVEFYYFKEKKKTNKCWYFRNYWEKKIIENLLVLWIIIFKNSQQNFLKT